MQAPSSSCASAGYAFRATADPLISRTTINQPAPTGKGVRAPVKILYAICTAVTLTLAGFGIVYCVRTTVEQRINHWNKISNFFVTTAASVRSYVTGLFAGVNSNQTSTV